MAETANPAACPCSLALDAVNIKANVLLCCFAGPTDKQTCLNDTDCGDSKLRCDLSSPTIRAVCRDGAVDYEQNLGKCVNTPCRRCQLCLADMAAHVAAVKASTALLADPGVVADQLSAYCKAKVLSVPTKYSAAACDAAVSATRLSYQGNAGKRAAVICQNLGECVVANITASCLLGSTTNTDPFTPKADGVLDFCTPSGTNTTSAIDLLPGIDLLLTANQRPPSPQCKQDWHCNNTVGFQCVAPAQNDTTAPKRVTCSGGVDTVDYMGTCKPTPCQQCKTCFTDMKTFAALYASNPDAVAVAAAFKTECLKKMDPVKCSLAALQVEDSFFGNLAKRPVSMCWSLGLCNITEECVLQANTTATDTSVTVANADACTSDGKPYAAGGKLLAKLTGSPSAEFVADNGE